MSKSITIPKQSSFPEYLDWEKLREAGIKHLETLSGKIWTDYNTHDPGITLLEVLCYALTDLGYRTNFDMNDLVAPKEPLLQENNFFTPAEILTNNPLTITDYRKLLVDIRGVRNAWLLPTGEADPTVYIDCKASKLQLQPLTEKGKELPEVPIRGLYKVMLELEDRFETDACGAQLKQDGAVVAEVKKVLCAHRNLTEDFQDICVLDDEEIGVCADIELAPGADPAKVLLELYDKIHLFISPQIDFHTLNQMLAQGKTMEEIFAGRPLRYPSHGFVDTAQLESIELREYLRASDFYQVMMDVEGIVAVKKLRLFNYINGLSQGQGHDWTLKLTPGHRPVFSPQFSKLNFYKGILPVFIASDDKKEALELFEERKAARLKVLQPQKELDFEVPPGENRELTDYLSLQEDLPLYYGVGEQGYDDNFGLERKAQARQLQAFLLLFDQLLADYLAQLSELRELFSYLPDSERHNSQNRSYFTRALKETPGMEAIFEGVLQKETVGSETFITKDFKGYTQFIDTLAEDKPGYQARRNRFLNHLLGRFAESFTDYVALMFSLRESRELMLERLIEDKARFLKHYPELSRNRGKAFNYCDCEATWDTDNVDGLVKKVGGLLGVRNTDARYLSNCEVMVQDKQFFAEWYNCDQLIFRSVEGFATELEAKEALEEILKAAQFPENYELLDEPATNSFSFRLKGGEGQLLAEHQCYYYTEERCDRAIDEALTLAQTGGQPFRMLRVKGQHYFQLLNAEGDVLLESRRIFKTLREAEAAFLELLQIGAEVENYEKITLVEVDEQAIDTEEGAEMQQFTFVLKGDGWKAHHPRNYFSETERDEALAETAHYLLNRGVPCQLFIREGYFIPELRDTEGKIWLRHFKRFETEEEAQAACAHLLERAAVAENYVVGFEEKACKYGFYLSKEDGDILAEHEGLYETEAKAREHITLLIEGIAAEKITCQLYAVPEKFRFHLEDFDEEALFIGLQQFDTKQDARAACSELIAKAKQPQFYRITEDESGLFGFDIATETERLAFHPNYFDTVEAATEASHAVLEFLRIAEPFAHFGEAEELFYFDLLDADGQTLLLGQQGFETEEEAEDAYHYLLRMASIPDNFQIVENGDGRYSVEIRNHYGERIALMHHDFEDEKAAAEAIEAIIFYILTIGVPVGIRETEGSGCYFEILSATGKVLLKSISTYGSRRETILQAALAIRRGKLLPHYQTTDDAENCHFTFTLYDDDDEACREVLAIPPKGFESEKERDQALQFLVEYLNGFTLHYEIFPSDGEWRYQWLNAECQPQMVSTHTWKSASRALRAFRYALGHATDVDNYLREQAEQPKRYHCFLTDDEGRKIAQHPEGFGSQRAWKEAVSDFVFAANNPRPQYEAKVQPPHMKFLVLEGEGNVLLEGCQIWHFDPEDEHNRSETEAEVWNAGQDLVIRAQEEENYFLADPFRHRGHALALEGEGFVRAIGTEQPESLAAAADLAKELAATFDQNYLLFETWEAIGTDPEGNTLSRLHFTDPEQVVDNRFVKVLQVLPKVRDEAQEALQIAVPYLLADPLNYAPFQDSETEQFGFRVLGYDGQPFAVSPLRFNEATDRDAAMERLLQQFSFPLFYSLMENGTGWHFDLATIDHELTNTEPFESEREALNGLLAAYRLASNLENYRYQQTEEGTHQLLLVDTRRILAEHPQDYATEAPRNEAWERCLHRANDEGLFLVEHLLLRPATEGTQFKWGFVLTNADGETLLQSLSRYTTREQALAAAGQLLELKGERGLYVRHPQATIQEGEESKATADEASFTFWLLDAAGQPLATSAEMHCPGSDTDEALEGLLEKVAVVETTAEELVWLDPMAEAEDPLLPVWVEEEDCQPDLLEGCIGSADPYSFWVSVVLPYWPKRFRNMDFRRYFEEVLRREAPAHIALKICWVDVRQMRDFEIALRKWREDMCLKPRPCFMNKSLSQLIDTLYGLTNVYPSGGRLHDCDEAPEGNPFVLNQTNLSTEKTTGDDQEHQS